MAKDYKKEFRELKRLYNELEEERDDLLEEQEELVKNFEPIVELLIEYLDEDQIEELEGKIEEFQQNLFKGVQDD